MWIIDCDFHPQLQQIGFVNTATGEYGTAHLEHSSGEGEGFYRKLVGQPVRVEPRQILLTPVSEPG